MRWHSYGRRRRCGVPLADLYGDWAARLRHALTQELLAVAVERFHLELEAGHHADVIPALSEMHAAHPAAQPVATLLIRALSGAGDHAEGLRVYARFRQRIADELGVEPGAELRALHRQLLQSGPSPGARRYDDKPRSRSSSGARPPVAAGGRPAQLPAVPGFVGRRQQLQRLNLLLATDARVLVVEGMAGVGKPIPGKLTQTHI